MDNVTQIHNLEVAMVNTFYSSIGSCALFCTAPIRAYKLAARLQLLSMLSTAHPVTISPCCFINHEDPFCGKTLTPCLLGIYSLIRAWPWCKFCAFGVGVEVGLFCKPHQQKDPYTSNYEMDFFSLQLPIKISPCSFINHGDSLYKKGPWICNYKMDGKKGGSFVTVSH